MELGPGGQGLCLRPRSRRSPEDPDKKGFVKRYKGLEIGLLGLQTRPSFEPDIFDFEDLNHWIVFVKTRFEEVQIASSLCETDELR